MALEDLTGASKFIDSLVVTNPAGSDSKSTADDHLRGIKNVVKNTFPNVAGAVSADHAELSILDGVTATASELNYVDVTSPGTTQASKAVVTDASGNVTFGGSQTFSNPVTVATPTATGHAATKGYVDTAVSNLVDAAPGALDTLNELAAAIGDDANFSTTVTNSIATKVSKAGDTMTGALTLPSDPASALQAATKQYVDTRLKKDGSEAMSGALSMGNNKITNVTDPTSAQDASTKAYTDAILGSAQSAEEWATKTTGTVDGTDYSAKYHALAAGTSATGAASSATAAASSATSAASSATSASSSATSATSSANSASTSATNAAASASAASASQSAAAASQSAAATSETNAASSASTASTAATNAATSASSASTSATNAASSATSAASSASTASTAATSAAASYDAFDDRYLGAKAAAPATDNDGDPLVTGALYFDTTTDTMKVYSSGGWTAAGSSVNGTANRYDYVVGTASGSYDGSSNTTFPATYDAGYVDVWLNGAKLVPTTDFTATSGTQIVLTSAASAGANVCIVGYGTFSLANFSVGDANDVDLSGISDGDALFYNSTSGNFEAGPVTAPTPAAVSDAANSSTGYFALPAGTTAQRPASPVAGMIRHNTDNDVVETYNGTSWDAVGEQRSPYLVEYLIVAGGGGGGGAESSNNAGGGGGGGGAGGAIDSSTTIIPFSSNTITIGGGGGGGQSNNYPTTGYNGGNGTASTAFGQTAVGGGFGGGDETNQVGSGGSGGGGGGDSGSTAGSGTSGQGYAGGSSYLSGARIGGAGGGASASPTNKNGAAGINWKSLGTTYAGGGGGGYGGANSGGTGGAGGGGSGVNIGTGGNGSTNTGGGGGGAGAGAGGTGGLGGSGIVIIRYAGSQKGTGGTVTSSGGYTIHTFTSSGTFTA